MAVGRQNSPADQNIVRLRTTANAQTHLISGRRENEVFHVQFHIIDVIFMLLSLVTFVADLLTDIFVAGYYFNTASVVWGTLTLLFIFVPMVILQVFSLIWFLADATYKRPFLYVIHILLLGPLLRYLLVLKNAFKAWKTRGQEDVSRFYQQQNDLCILRLFESFLESAPQVLLQLYIVLRTHDASWVTSCSAVISLLSLAWSVAAYTNAMRLATYDNYSMSCKGLTVLSLWRLFMLTSRIITLVIFTAAFQGWIFLVLGIHWAAMFVWITLQKTDFCGTWLTERLYNVVVAVIYCFSFFNVSDGRTRWRVVGFYAAMLVENTVLLVAWLAAANPAPWKMWCTVAGVYGSFVLGLICMLLYYRFCHPSTDTKTKTGHESVYVARAYYHVWHNATSEDYGTELFELEDRTQMNNVVCEDYLEPTCHGNPDMLDCDSIDLSLHHTNYSLTTTPLLRKFLQSRLKPSSSRDDCSDTEKCLPLEEVDGAVGGSEECSHVEHAVCVSNCDDQLDDKRTEHCNTDNESTYSEDILEMKLKCNPSYTAEVHDSKPHYFQLENERLIPTMDLGELLTLGTDTSNELHSSSTELNSSFLSIPTSDHQKTSSEDLQHASDCSRDINDYASFLEKSLPLDGSESSGENTHSESGASGIHVSLTSNAMFEEHSSIDSVLDDKELNGESARLAFAKDLYRTQQNNYVFI